MIIRVDINEVSQKANITIKKENTNVLKYKTVNVSEFLEKFNAYRSAHNNKIAKTEIYFPPGKLPVNFICIETYYYKEYYKTDRNLIIALKYHVLDKSYDALIYESDGPFLGMFSRFKFIDILKDIKGYGSDIDSLLIQAISRIKGKLPSENEKPVSFEYVKKHYKSI